MALLDDVKIALRVSTDAYDSELTDLIESAKLDLGIAGVVIPEPMTTVVSTAVKTYCKLNTISFVIMSHQHIYTI